MNNEKIILKKFNREDIELYVQATEEWKSTGNGLGHKLRKISAIYQKFERDGFFSRNEGKMLILSESYEILGYCSYFRSAPYMDGYEIGYQIFDPKDRGKGYGTEALKLFTEFLFRTYTISRLQICMEEENLPAERVALRARFAFEGLMRGVLRRKGKSVNLKLYGITREDWESIREESI